MRSKQVIQRKRAAILARRRKRRRIQRKSQDDLLHLSQEDVESENLPADKTARALRQASLLRAQKRYGNAYVQRLLEKNGPVRTEETGAGVRVSTGVATPSVQRGFWSSIKKGLSKAWKGIKKGAKAAWSGITKGAKAVWSGVKWVGKQLWSKLKGIYHRAVGWITKLPGRLKRLFSTLWKGVKSLKPWSLKWWKSLGKASTWKGFLKWLGTAGIQLLEVAGIGELYETAMDFIKFNTRPLTSGERKKANVVFQGSINLDLVRVDEHALLGPSWTKREYVSFNTINAWGPMDDHTLIHELTHVWQYTQMGAIYMPKAIHAQKTGGYEYGGLTELRKRQAKGQNIHSFNLEQQGQITGDYYVGKTNGSLKGADLATYEHFIKDVR